MNKSKSNNKSVWSDVPKRLLTILLGIPFVYKLLSNPITSYIFFMGAHLLSAWEYTLLEPQLSVSTSTSSSVSGHRRRRILFCIMSVLLACIPDNNNNHQSSNTNTFNLFIFILSLMGCIYVILDNNSSNNSNSSYTSGIANHYIIGLLFITIPFRAWCNLAISTASMQTTTSELSSQPSSSSSSSSFASTISVLLIVWNTDTGALIVGRLLGRRNKKINETKNTNSGSNVPEWIQKISPAKTMEGFLGGIFGGIITSIWLLPFLLNSLSIIDCSNIDTDDTDTTSFCILWGGSTSSSIIFKRFLIGLSLALFAIVGDLVESAIKRKSKTKDSGSILPGHGGILDRFDSSLIAILFYRYIVCVYFTNK